jgi:phosphoribosylformimino-5-aminoimidazole carboxamide ribotide isomerase
MKVIPAIDLMDGRVVRLRKGRFDEVSHYEQDAAELAEMFRKHVDRLHVVDLDGARAGRPVQVDVLARIARAFGAGVQIGGGLRTESDIEAALSLADRAVIGTAAVRDQAMVERLVARHPQRIVVAVDASDGSVKISGWEEDGQTSVDTLVDRLCALPLAGILYTDIARDGTEVGPNIPATSALALRCPFDVTASGGVGCLDHIAALAAAPGPIASVVVGRALHEGRFQLADAVQNAARPPLG